MNTAILIVTIAEVIASVLLILVVLLQSGKESGLSGAISGSNNESYMGKGKRASLDKKLATATKWIALVWILLTLALTLLNVAKPA